MIKKSKKNFLILTLILYLTLTTFCQTVNAWEGNIEFANTGGSSSSEDKDKNIEKEISTEENGNTYTKYTCVYNYNLKTSKKVTIQAYDYINNKELLNNKKLEISSNNKILAGTYIGLDITEKSEVSWEFEILEVRADTYKKAYETAYKECQCKYTSSNSGKKEDIIKSETLINATSNATVTPIVRSCSQEDGIYNGSCPQKLGCKISSYRCYNKTISYESEFSSTETITSGEKYNQCKKMANEDATNQAKGFLYSSYNLNLKDSNDAESEMVTTIIPTGKNELSNVSVGEPGKTYKSEYKYKPSKVCMNIKTAKVSYVTKCGDDEIEIQQQNNYWPYFIPLNYKSNKSFSFNLTPSYKINKSQCEYVINNNPEDYINLIVTEQKEQFTGNAKNDKKTLTQEGCYLSSTVSIPVTQKFYNEVNSNDKITFEGFNFYYKPIDITNPFPNGLNVTSLWYDMNNNNKIDFTNSYKIITYVAENINTTTVRNYNQDNQYTSWDNMTLNGKSNYIEKNGIVKRLVENTSFYKLGCGPANSIEKFEDGTSNQLYLVRCKQ